MTATWPPAPGEVRPLSGDITTLNAIGGPRPAADVERMLGFRPGRLQAGYQIALLIEPLAAGDFDFAGTTLRSGGRLGLPLGTRQGDQTRLHVSEEMRAEYGASVYETMKAREAARAPLIGSKRLAKVLPRTSPPEVFSPKVEFPMGGGGLQWTIRKTRPRRFLVALDISAGRIATAPGFTVSLAEDQPSIALYEARARIARYLETALPSTTGPG